MTPCLVGVAVMVILLAWFDFLRRLVAAAAAFAVPHPAPRCRRPLPPDGMKRAPEVMSGAGQALASAHPRDLRPGLLPGVSCRLGDGSSGGAGERRRLWVKATSASGIRGPVVQ